MGKSKTRKTFASQRQLQVGELLRHALAEIFRREPLYEPELAGQSITVSEVRVSPDLRNATVYFSTLGGKEEKSVLAALNRINPVLRRAVATKVNLRYAPMFSFKPDPTFNQAEKIDLLLRKGQGHSPSSPTEDPHSGN